MSITRWSPMRELEAMRDRFDRMFSDMEAWPEEWRAAVAMPVDVKETDDDVIVSASMPGFKRDEISVDMRNDRLHLKGTHREEVEETKGTWHRRERRFGSAERYITLPAAVDHEKADAKLADGVLTVTLPKESPEPDQRIEIKTD